MPIKSKFCPRCGKEAKLVEGLCADCYVNKSGASIRKAVSISVCKKCGAIEVRGIWTLTDESPEHYLTGIMLPKLRLPEGAELKNLEITETGKHGKAKVTFKVGKKEFSENIEADMEINKTVCPNCGMKLGKTHMAILQIRSDHDTIQLVDKVLRFSERYKTNIIKTENQRAGIDIFMSSKEAARHLASELRTRFRMKIKESHELYSWDKIRCRPKSRVNILLSRQ